MHLCYSSHEFEEKYTYTGADLGATWEPDETTFRLWAPTAEEVTINLYHSGDVLAPDLFEQLTMEPDVNGTWVARKGGDLHGIYYTYLVMVDGQMLEACDPYAKATGVNGQRAMVVDLASTDPNGWVYDRDPNYEKTITDCVICEAHVRDLTSSKAVRFHYRGKFLGVAETGRKTRGGFAAGLDHLKELGITHLHLLPVFDYGACDERKGHPEYNWGYDPVNFNVPEGSYSTNPHNGEVRIREMKQMVKALHDNGISVVMDVVYNHVYQAEAFCFNQIVPGYFSRTLPDGSYTNGSCCGNDTASERSMVRKYIVDSVKYWADEYHIDGFRFDLVGLIDTVTIQTVMEEVHKAHPNVIFYGEGWTMNTTATKPDVSMTVQANSHLVPGFSFFSDTLRDLMRGSVFHSDVPGFVCGGCAPKETLHQCFMGIPHWAAEPEQCVNYVSCHDNHTLYDRIRLSAPEAPDEVLAKMSRLAGAFTILSQGVPFFLAGEEILRSKPSKRGSFEHNSYRSPDRVNAIRWEDLDKEENRITSDYYKNLIAFRKAHPCLRFAKREQVHQHVTAIHCRNDRVVAFQLEDKNEELIVIFNSDTQSETIPLPQGKWAVNVYRNKAGTASLDTVEGAIRVPSISTAVLSRKKPIDVVAALIWEKDKFLICQRPKNKARGLLWEFAGGKVEPGETLKEALIRECQEELAVTLEVREQFMQVVHEYPDMLIRLTLFHCVIPEGFPQKLEHNDLQWIRTTDIDQYDFCPADVDILKELKRRYDKRIPL